MSVAQRVIAAALAIAAVVAVVFAFAGDDGASSSGSTGSALATPMWSARRVPQPFVDAVGAQRLQRLLDEDFGGDGTCFVVDAGGAQLAAHNPDTPLLGASTQKILVAAAMLATFGNEFRYETKVVAPAAPQDGTVDRLWLIGGGDPVLSTAEYRDFLKADPERSGDATTSLEALADSVVAAGVKNVPGGIVADDSRYDDVRYVPTWEPQYARDGDVGPLSALTVNDGFRSWTSGRKITADDPGVYAASELRRLLVARGVTVGPAARGDAPPAPATEVAKVSSEPLRALVASMVSSSDNVSAELFTKELGTKPGQPGSTAAGVAATTAKLQELGVPQDGLLLKDGSGLDRGNRVTCRILVAALALGERPELAGLWDGLPIAGQTGTLVDELQNTPITGKMRGKTGTLNGVSGLLGMVDLGRSVRFAFLDNGDFTQTKGEALRGEAATKIATYPNAPTADELVPKPAR